jgi:hypothetical protein
VAAVSCFLKLDANLEVLESGHNMGLIENEVDALWSRVRMAADSLASHIPSSVARNPLVGAGSSIVDPFCFCLSMNHPDKLKQVIRTI